MRKMFLLAMAMFLVIGLAGCGSDGETKTVYIQSQDATVAKEGTFTVVSAKSQKLQFVVDESGNLKNLRDGGIQVKPADVDHVAFSSYRFGDYQNSPYVSTLNKSLEALFSNLPNNDQWGRYYVVLKSGKKFLVELSEFKVVEMTGFYHWIDPSSSSLEYGDIEADSSQDRIEMTLNQATMIATINGQFGCDKIFGTKAGSFDYQPGMKMAVELGNGNVYYTDFVQDAAGNLSYVISGIPVVAGPYYSMDGITPAPVATTIKDMYIILPNGGRVQLSFGYNTQNENDSEYVWYFDTNNAGVELWISQYESPMVINYSP